MTRPSVRRPIGLALAMATAVCVAVAVWLFPKAQPTISLKQELTRDEAIARARTFALAHQLPVQGAREAVRFEQDGETQIFTELEAGGKTAVNAEVNRGDVALFAWRVRFFRAGDPHEVQVTLAPSGRVLGFRNILAAADARPALDSAQATARADAVRTEWLADRTTAWRVVSTSVETVQPSGRLDRTVTYERTDRTLGAAPLRLDVVVRGDVVGEARQYVKVPASFERRYAERRADNDLLAQIASLVMVLFAVLGIAALVGARGRGTVRWRPALLLGGGIGVALLLAQLNEIPGSYFQYDTALPQGTFVAMQVLLAVLSGVGMGGLITVVLAAGELLTREAFPEHFDWWSTMQYAGTRPVALRVLGGYTVAALGLAYVSVFYLAVERGLGWWSPSGLLDDPNLIATPLPWLSAVATSLQAGVLEEVLFRAIPIALVARAVGNRPWRPYALAASVVVTALVFGFAHANYPSFPAYARGVELFAEAALWAVLYIRVGLVTTVVGHFTFDLILFGLFASAGTATPYRVALAVVVLAALAPALWVLRQFLKTGGLTADAPDAARFSAWRPMARAVTAERPIPTVARVQRAGWVTKVLAAGVLLAFVPTERAAPPRFTASRQQAIATSDSVLRTVGATPAGWTRLTEASTSTWKTEARFLAEFDSTKSIAARVARTWMHGGSWTVRYVHTAGDVAARTESWKVIVSADGQPHTWEHIIADSAPAPALPRADAESAARAALVAAGAPAAALTLISAKETAKPARRDVEFEFADGSIVMPGNASLRWTATVSGDRVTRLGHRIFLPEAWERQDTSRTVTRSAIAAGVLLLLVILGGFLLVRFMRQRPLVPALAWPSRGRMIGIVAVMSAVMFLTRLNDWPTKMAGWDTASPFNRHQWTTISGMLLGALGPLMLWGLWLAADAARRRMGVPVQSPTRGDALWTGAALAAGPALMGALPALVFGPTTTSVSTVMNQVVPVLGHVTNATNSAFAMAAVAVLASSAALAVRSSALRVLLLALVAVSVGSVTAEDAVSSSEWMARAAVSALAIGGMCAIWWRVGRASMEAWLAGALMLQYATGLASRVSRGTADDGFSFSLGAWVAWGVCWFVTSRPRAQATSAVTDRVELPR